MIRQSAVVRPPNTDITERVLRYCREELAKVRLARGHGLSPCLLLQHPEHQSKGAVLSLVLSLSPSLLRVRICLQPTRLSLSLRRYPLDNYFIF